MEWTKGVQKERDKKGVSRSLRAYVLGLVKSYGKSIGKYLYLRGPGLAF